MATKNERLTDELVTWLVDELEAAGHTGELTDAHCEQVYDRFRNPESPEYDLDRAQWLRVRLRASASLTRDGSPS